jgi:hypothetical protein
MEYESKLQGGGRISKVLNKNRATSSALFSKKSIATQGRNVSAGRIMHKVPQEIGGHKARRGGVTFIQ